jgi:two-component system, chemotaxis family, protein-glutamate methylesterase/glutaminase
MQIQRSGANYVVLISDTEPINRHRPSVDVMFDSVAACAGANATGVMLTGMGNDGAAGMKRMRDAGSFNLAQDEASCVVYGMPREAVVAGAVHESLPLNAIAGRLCNLLKQGTGFASRL